MDSPSSCRLNLAAELRDDLRLPSESQRIPCVSPPRDWQLLDAPHKAWATVSMIDTVWEKLTKVSDEVEELQAAPAELWKAVTGMEEQLKARESELRAAEERLRLQELAEPRATLDQAELERQLQPLHRELEEMRAALEEGQEHRLAHQKELHVLRNGVEEGRQPAQQLQDQQLQLRRDMEQLKLSLEAAEARWEQRLKSSNETAEMGQSSCYEKLRLQLQQQLQQEMERQEGNLAQLKQRVGEDRDEASDGLRRVQKQLDALEGDERRLSRSQEDLRRLVESGQEDTRRGLDASKTAVHDLELGLRSTLADLQSSMERQLQGTKQETAARCDELAESLARSCQESKDMLQGRLREASTRSDEKLGELRTQMQEKLEESCLRTEELGCSLREDFQERLKELEEKEMSSRLALEERSEELLDLGLQKLAKEVAERMDRQQEQQRLASLAGENRLSGHLESCYQRLAAMESWRTTWQEREAAREVYVKTVGDQLKKLESQELVLQRSLEEVRQQVREDLQASAMNAFQGEMRLWAKMAQMGIAPS